MLRLAIQGGPVLKTRESWPRANRSYCHPAGEWPAEAEILEEVPVTQCRRRGSAIDLVLDRRVNYRFADRPVTSERRALSAGD